MSRKPPIFKLTDVRKAFQAAQAAGVHASVTIQRDGTLCITPVAPLAHEAPAPDAKPKGAEPATGLRSWD
jgi:hypothetical protein